MAQFNAFDSIDPAQWRDTLDLDLPPTWRVEVAARERVEPLQDPEANVAAALVNPMHSFPLTAMVGPGDDVCIVFTHPTAGCPDRFLVPPLLRALETAGVRDQDILLLCAGGLYGRTSHEEKVEQLGAEILERYRVIDHDLGEVIHLGQWQNVPLTINRRLLEADLVIATGVVAPHLYAGYSGGAETVGIGCCGDTTIEAIHAPRFIYNPSVRPGQVEGNPFQEVLRTMAQRAGLRFVVNAVLDHNNRIVDVQAGDPLLVHKSLVFSTSSMNKMLERRAYDVVVAGLDAPHQVGLYQAVLGALYVGMSAQPVVRPEGVIILRANTPEAVGSGPNAQNFFSALQGVRSLDALIGELLERGYRPGEARAFQLARMLERNEVIVVGSEFPAIVKACRLNEVADMAQAVDLTRWLLGDDLDVLILPHALHALPIPTIADSNEWMDVALADRQT